MTEEEKAWVKYQVMLYILQEKEVEESEQQKVASKQDRLCSQRSSRQHYGGITADGAVCHWQYVIHSASSTFGLWVWKGLFRLQDLRD